MYYDVVATDIQDRWRVLTVEEVDQAGFLIADATHQIDVKRPMVHTMATVPVDEDDKSQGANIYRIVRQLIIDAVQQVLRNPDVMDAQQIGADGSLGFQFRTNNELKQGQSGLRLQVSEIDLTLLDAAIYGPLISGRGGVYMMPLWDPDPVTT